MAKTLGSKCTRCRREGQKLFLKGDRCLSSKCALVRRNYPPGVHGPKGRPRLSGYGSQLREKQKVKRLYGILERQFHGYYERAKKQHGQTGVMMLSILERRLDNVLYRAGFSSSRSQARQLVAHGHVEVNGKSTNIPSLLVKSSDVIRVKNNRRQENYWATLREHYHAPEGSSWLQVNADDFTITVIQLPGAEVMPQDLQMSLIVEYYSR